MLQVITGMYFRDVRLNPTVHRRTLYTNADLADRDRITLPIGHLTPDTERAEIGAVLAEVTERLEAILPDGTEDFMLSTGGRAIIDDLAAVLSFALDAVFTPLRETAERVIRAPSGSFGDPDAADILPRTFTPHRAVSNTEIDELASFMADLLALNRAVYERAMKAIRRIVTASERAAEDPTLAYTDYVAALESLSTDFDPGPITWTRMDSKKRKVLDPALTELAPDAAEKVRQAILAAERAGAKHKYVEFVLDHVRPSFFRDEAVDVLRPASRPALRVLVKSAYDSRSSNVHSLTELAIHRSMLVGGAHTVAAVGHPAMLTLAGLNHLARHVVRTYVKRGSHELDQGYDWRADLPNVMRGRLSPEFYLGRAETWRTDDIATRTSEFLGLVIAAMGNRAPSIVDLRPVLEHIETLLTTTARSPAIREPLLATYLLWHQVVPEEMARPAPAKFLDLAFHELEEPSVYAYAARILLKMSIPWSAEQVLTLAEQRYEQLGAPKPAALPARLDSALWITATELVWAAGDHDRSCVAIGRAVECSPGHAGLVALESEVLAEHDVAFDVRDFLIDPLPLPTEA